MQQLKDEERLAILQRIDFNARHIEQFTPYDAHIDKRKYNHLQNWIKDRLQAIDTDERLKWMLETGRKIMTDSIQIEEEKELLKLIRDQQHTVFFTHFYELVRHYRHFLLIRLRYTDHQLADQYLRQFATAYDHAKAVQDKLHDATVDIVAQYAGQGSASRQWADWLTNVFYDTSLDGHIRYLALVRLAFICYNYKEYHTLKEMYTYLEKEMFTGRFYSKRTLLNFYNNLLMLHSHYREYDKAVYYGYLSIRDKNHDYPLYVNNLCAVLLRLGRKKEALELMKKAAPVVKKTPNFHNRVGFVAFYMEALNQNGLYKNAESYGDIFLKAFSKEIIRYRWHLFFSVYLEAMLHQQHYDKVLHTASRFSLLQQDKSYQQNPGYLPVIPLWVEIAQYKEGSIGSDRLLDSLTQYVSATIQKEKKTDALLSLHTLLERVAPEIAKKLKSL
ncbi:MAG: hypothetical protein R2795_16860 [Saprospiraceae bacterium]